MLVLAQTAPPLPARATVSQPGNDSAKPLPENYQLTLNVTEKDKPATELSMIIATADFKAETAEPSMTFTGTLTPEESGAIIVRYGLGVQVAVNSEPSPVPSPGFVGPPRVGATQFKNIAAQASVRVRLGEPLNILNTANRVFTLTVSLLPRAR